MKKILITLSTIGIILFLFMNSQILASSESEESYAYAQNYHRINFKNLNSKKLNDLFIGINGTLIEIEVENAYFTKVYRFNTGLIDDIESLLTEKVVSDLINIGKRELATNFQINGIKINRIDILCTTEELNKIKNRALVE